MNVFTIPYAGGSCYSYRSLIKLFPCGFNAVSLELPGRGKRCAEKLLDRIDLMTADLFNQVHAHLDAPYILYGHSMGGLLANELVREIAASGLPMPGGLLVTGCGAPSMPSRRKALHKLSQEEFLERLRSLGGSPPDVLNSPSIMEFYEPILRSDFKALDEFNYKRASKLTVPIVVGIALNEDITKEEADAWQLETMYEVEIKYFDGDHFFIFENAADVVTLLLSMASRHTSLCK